MSFIECSLCGEPLTAPQIYKGAPYGSSCIHKAIAMDVPNAGTGKRKPTPKPIKDIWLSFKVDSIEPVGKNIHVRSSEWGKGYFELSKWYNNNFFSNLRESIILDESKNILMVNFGNGQYNLREKRNNWKWKHEVLVRHKLIVFDYDRRIWVENKNLFTKTSEGK